MIEEGVLEATWKWGINAFFVWFFLSMLLDRLEKQELEQLDLK
jgi:hypothetical protein